MQETRPRSSVLSRTPLGFPWQTSDPFLFCVHHNDAYPAGNEAMGPAASLEGRNIGQDFAGKDGWSMYHGEVVPGFPQHPHRGFETVTLVRKGFIDHSDSLGATARFGEGDAQWLTAGRGINHCEMFPLRKRDADNPTELFQIWLNLPRASKMVEPYFSMFWRDAIPRRELKDRMGRAITLLLVAGKLEDGGALGEKQPPVPPPDSWASNPASALAIWTIRLSPGAEWTLPPAPPGTTRNLYFFRGSALTISGEAIPPRTAVGLVPDMETPIVNGNEESELLLLQGRPIGEPVVQHGPFVMNTVDEIQKAFFDYRNTRFGGWPWPHDAPVHPRDEGRFAKYPDGRVERPQQ
ncbi:MAG: pirin family protein [Polyangiaceae bacterium]|nr:pirin family protein [Polyangiaceae bacterium]